MDKRLAAERTRMYKVIREAHPLYFGDPMKFYADGARTTEDPFGGPMYQEYNGSGGGFLGAVLGVVAAVATGGASLGFTTIASTLSTVSLISTVVGAVTGNKSFATLGALAGLGSGFMSLSQAGKLGDGLASWANETNDKWSAFTDQNISTAQAISSAGTEGSGTIDMSSPATPDQSGMVGTADTTGAINSASGDYGLKSLDASGVNTDALSSAKPEISDGLINSAADPDVGGLQGALDKAGVDTVGDTADGASKFLSENTSENIIKGAENPGGISAEEAARGDVKTPGKSTGIGDIFKSVNGFAKEYKDLINGAGTVMQLFKPDSVEAQNELLKSRTALTDTQTSILNQQVANASAVPDIRNMYSVNTNANIGKKPVYMAGPRPAGLIQTRSA